MRMMEVWSLWTVTKKKKKSNDMEYIGIGLSEHVMHKYEVITKFFWVIIISHNFHGLYFIIQSPSIFIG